jgi:hypothetical protein
MMKSFPLAFASMVTLIFTLGVLFANGTIRFQTADEQFVQEIDCAHKRGAIVSETAIEIAKVLVEENRQKWCVLPPENWDWQKEPVGVIYLNNALNEICGR